MRKVNFACVFPCDYVPSTYPTDDEFKCLLLIINIMKRIVLAQVFYRPAVLGCEKLQCDYQSYACSLRTGISIVVRNSDISIVPF